MVKLKPDINRRLRVSTLYGLGATGKWGMKLVKPVKDFWGYTVKPVVDINRVNYHNEKLKVINKSQTKIINSSLGGYESYPMLEFVCSTALGFAVAPLGVIGTAATIVHGLASVSISYSDRTSQNVRARQGDELWQTEFLSRRGKKITYSYQLHLVDPYRRKAKLPYSWHIHEKRFEIELE